MSKVLPAVFVNPFDPIYDVIILTKINSLMWSITIKIDFIVILECNEGRW